MKVKVDQDLCIGCGVCEGAVPEVFTLENGTTAEVTVEEVPKKLKDEVRQTSKDCPVEAILVEEDEEAEMPTESETAEPQELETALELDEVEKAADSVFAEINTKEKGSEMKVIVDQDLCIGCGVCEGICPEVFSLANEPYAEVLLDPIPEEYQELCRQAAADCPSEAIKIEE